MRILNGLTPDSRASLVCEIPGAVRCGRNFMAATVVAEDRVFFVSREVSGVSREKGKLLRKLVGAQTQNFRHGFAVLNAEISAAVQILIHAVLADPGLGHPLPALPPLRFENRHHDALSRRSPCGAVVSVA